MNVPPQIVSAMELLQVLDMFVTAAEKADTFEQIQQALEQAKAQAKKNYKQFAAKHHPDKPEGDPEVMKGLNIAMDILEPVKLHRLQPRPQVRHVVININFGGGFGGGGFGGFGGFGGGTNTSGTGGGWY